MTATLLSDIVWEGLASEMTDVLPGIRDGHFYKQSDTGESYFRRDNAWEFINLGLSFIKATKSGSVVTDGVGFYHVAFSTPFADANYTVALSVANQNWGARGGCIAYTLNLATTGFDILTKDVTNVRFAGVTVSWLATRDYDP